MLALDLLAWASLAEHAVKSAVAQNEPSADLARVCCVLSGCGTCSQGYRGEREHKGMTAKGHLREWYLAFQHPHIGHARGRVDRSRLLTVAQTAEGGGAALFRLYSL